MAALERGRLSPPRAGAGFEVDPCRAGTARSAPGCNRWPSLPLEQDEQLLRNEPRARRIDVPIALGVLAVGEEALGHDEMQVVLGARHGDVEQPPFLLDLGRRCRCQVRWNAAVDDVEHEHRLPFLALGGVDGREDQIVLIEQRHAGLVARGVGRIERQLGQEALARGIARGDLLELEQVGLARRRILVDAVEMRLVPAPCLLDFGRPAGRPARSPSRCRRTRASPSPARGGAGTLAMRRDRIGRLGHVVEHALRRRWPDARQELQHAEAGDAVARVLDEAQQRQQILDVRGVEELQAAELDEGDVAAGQLDLERSAMVRGPEQDRLLLQRGCQPRGSPARARRCSAPGRPRRAR